MKKTLSKNSINRKRALLKKIAQHNAKVRSAGDLEMRRAEDEEDGDEMDFDLDSLLEEAGDDVMVIDDEALEEVTEDEEGEVVCPPGCVPEGEEVEEIEVEIEEDEEDKDEEKEDEKDEDEDEEKEDKDEDEDKKEAAVYARLVSAADLKEMDTAPLQAILHYDEQDPYYILTVAGKPVGELHRADQDMDPSLYDAFVDEDYANTLRQAAAQLGVSNMLEPMVVRYYAANTSETEEFQKAQQKVAAHYNEAFQKKVADFVPAFMNRIALAMEGYNKNLFGENPLRARMVKNLRQANLPERTATAMFDDAMQAVGMEYFDQVVAKATELMGMDEAAVGQVEAAIKKMAYATPQHEEDTIPSAPPVYQTMQQPRQAKAAVPEDEALVRAFLSRKKIR